MANYETLLELKAIAPDWDNIKTLQFEKNVYIEDERVKKRKPEAVEKWRASKEVFVEGPCPIPNPVTTFGESRLPNYILETCAAEGFREPTPIQSQTWPVIQSGHDLLAVSKTGSGKTLSYLLPAIVHIMAQPLLEPGQGPICLVLSPTRELATQISEQSEKFGESCRLKTACLYGGVSKAGQAALLAKGAEIVVATPGRLLDMVNSGFTNLFRVTLLVLDEADKMLSMGFEPFMRKIGVLIRPDRQCLLFTATLPSEVELIAEDFLKNHITVKIGAVDGELTTNHAVRQHIHVITEEQKDREVLRLLGSVLQTRATTAKIIVYCSTKRKVDELETFLRENKIPAVGIHGDKLQRDRDEILDAFRKGNLSVMVSTDMTSRGLDIKDVTHVVNYDFPSTIQEYVHRIGRTGRAGNCGEAHSLFTSKSYSLAPDLVTILEEAEQEVEGKLYDMIPNGKDRKAARELRKAGKMKRERTRLDVGPGLSAWRKSGVTSDAPQQTPEGYSLPEPPAPVKLYYSKDPSNVVLLRNMVGPGEVDQELKEAILEECQKYGEVKDVSIFEQKRWTSLTRVANEEAVRVFVSFERAEDAVQCWKVMNGRQFDGRTIYASFYDPQRLENNDLAPDSTLDVPLPRCLLLRNMVTADEVDEDLIPDTVNELSNFGLVQSCLVHIVPEEDKYKDLTSAERVRVFVRFATCEGATQALINLDGRMFAQKEICVTFFDDVRWDKEDFLPDDASEPPLPLRCLISTEKLPGE